MAYIVMAYIVMVYIVMADAVMPYIVMAGIVWPICDSPYVYANRMCADTGIKLLQLWPI